MEIGVRLIGLILRFLKFLLAPVFWIRARNDKRLPSILDPLLLKSATQLANAIRTGELRSEYVVHVYINRIRKVDSYLNAVVEGRYRAAAEDAKAADRQLAEARENGTLEQLVATKPLLGVPFTVKESCSVAGLSNAVGCLENSGSRATVDGAAVSLIRAAGAIPLVVTNTPELCLGWETTNLLKGTTLNPYDLNRTPGGSSGGEGALLASGAACFSVASDIAGSIRIPAAFCGVFGHKPTPGIIPIQGHIPMLTDELYPLLLTVGPMTRFAEDLPLVLGAMTQCRERLRLDVPVDMRKVKVHYMLQFSDSPALMPVDPLITDMIIRAKDYLQTQCGATVSEEKFLDLEDSVEISVSVFFSMKDIPNMLQDPANPKHERSLALELARCALGAACARLARPRSLQGLGFALVRRNQLFIPRARRPHYAREAAALKERLVKTLGTDGVLLYPVFTAPAHRHGEVFVRASGVAYTMIFNVLGAPATAVPVGVYGGLPLSIQVIAAPYQDRLCLAVAKELEKAFGGWVPPHPVQLKTM